MFGKIDYIRWFKESRLISRSIKKKSKYEPYITFDATFEGIVYVTTPNDHLLGSFALSLNKVDKSKFNKKQLIFVKRNAHGLISLLKPFDV